MARNNYGKTWWGEQWLNALNDIDFGNRLPRGKSYANKGMVSTIDIDKNIIHAKVEGSYPIPYDVKITMPPFGDSELSDFLQRLNTKPTIISKLLNRQLDKEVLTIAESIGLKVFPQRWTDLEMQCSCPDWAVPCKHIAAVIYRISVAIDNDPFMVFKLHQVDLIKSFKDHGHSISHKNDQVPTLEALLFKRETAPQKRKNTPADHAYQKLDFSDLHPMDANLSKLLGEQPAFYQGSGDFKSKYQSQLTRTLKKAQKLLLGKVTLGSHVPDLKQTKPITHHDHQTLVMDADYQIKVEGLEPPISLVDLMLRLSEIPNHRTSDYQKSTAALHTVLHTAIQFTATGAIIPQIIQRNANQYFVRWVPAMLSKDVRSLMETLEGIIPDTIFFWQEKKDQKAIDHNTAYHLLSIFITTLVDVLNNSVLNDPFLQLFFQNKRLTFDGPGEESLAGGIQSWLQKYYLSQGNYQPQIQVEEASHDLFEVKVGIREKNQDSWSVPIPLEKILSAKKYDQSRYEILKSVIQISAFIDGLDAYINSKGKSKILMDTQSFAVFLMDFIPVIRLLDVKILLPKSLQNIIKPKPSVKIKTQSDKSYIGLKDLFDFNWQIALGPNVVDQDEFKKLLKNSKGLIKYKSNYIHVDEKDLENLYKHFSGTKKLNAFQMLRAVISETYQGAPIKMTDQVKSIIREFTQVNDISAPKELKAQLRPYQQRGYSWMYRNARIGFGSVLADDMGLGKTLQVISTILKYKEEGQLKKEKVMVVVPTGLLSNWMNEIQKFAPSLTVKYYHGSNRQLDNNDSFDVLLSSYGILRSDAEKLKKRPWHTLVIDEAQNIKNITTNQTKAVKSIKARNYIAMSGTPIENRLSELWSIMDYSNRGFLGNIKEFNQTFSVPIAQDNDKEAAEKLKKTIAPFMMRRLKSDKSIISDLPEKIEMNTYATLAKQQASLYEQTLSKAMEDIQGIVTSDSKAMFVRRGLVLQMILALKQICNHPANFLKNNQITPELSGKTSLLLQRLDTIIENGEKVLIFTQFTEMGKILQQVIEAKYGDRPLFYHGGCSLKERAEMVDKFQNNRADKVFILSLKAAGTGLNLTAANHVIHYDLWWNPAVEAQATDRAYRIGQQKNVVVHRLITKNTFEEKIDAMLNSKRELAELTVASGENWIGNLNNKELNNLFKL